MSSFAQRILSSITLLSCLGLLLGSTLHAQASPGKQYVTLRRQMGWERRLTYREVQKNPAAYAGQVLEMRGTLGGKAESSDGMTIMLNMADGNAPMMDVPPAERKTIQEYSAPLLRVLARIEPGGGGNMVPLTVLAVAHDSEVVAIERAAMEQEKALERQRQERQRRQQQLATRAFRENTAGSYASRGGSVRLNPAGAGSVNVEKLAPRVRDIYPAYYNFIARHNPRLTAGQAEQIAFHLLNCADKANLDPRFIVAVIIAESDFDPNAVSRVGAMGLGQLMPGTARALGVTNPFDPVANLYGSVNYLVGRLNEFNSDISLALAAYNAGPNAVRKYRGVPPYRETQAYVRRITALYRRLCDN